MAFINRKISEQDRSFYQLERIESSKPRGVLHPDTYWVIDDDRKIYLREVWHSNAGPEPAPHPDEIDHEFHFFINSTTYLVAMTNDLKSRVAKRLENGMDLSEEWTIFRIEPRDEFSRLHQFTEILREAMLASKGGAASTALLVEKIAG
ncbi:hypothetical protein [Derxia lacustris]|uniref:hypothetical protein n=1 Tax=Derxia lacustris TaxID=764842 RepID=UPI00111C2E72|nr:hypothetical protein [Derxia lacustris]